MFYIPRPNTHKQRITRIENEGTYTNVSLAPDFQTHFTPPFEPIDTAPKVMQSAIWDVYCAGQHWQNGQPSQAPLKNVLGENVKIMVKKVTFSYSGRGNVVLSAEIEIGGSHHSVFLEYFNNY